MPLDSAKNFAKVTVPGGYSDLATSIVVSDGSRLPSAPFNAVWWNAAAYGDPSDDPDVEVIRVTNVATNTLTVTRAQEGTAATAKAAACKLIAGLTALAANSIATTDDLPPVNHREWLSTSGFDGIETEFVDALSNPCNPSSGLPVLNQIGYTVLKYTASASPAAGYFTLYGTDNKSVRYGRAPRAGQDVLADYFE